MRSIVAVLAVSMTLVMAAAAQAKVTDPRKCATITAGGASKHAYMCAHAAAIATVRTVMAKRQNVARWYAPTFCDMNRSLLAWNCKTFLGDHWAVSVRWRATSTGWHLYTSVAPAP